MVACAYDPSTQKAEAGELLWVYGQSGLHSEFQAVLGYRVRPTLRKIKTSDSLASGFVEVLRQWSKLIQISLTAAKVESNV